MILLTLLLLGCSALELNKTYAINDASIGKSIISTSFGGYAIVGAAYSYSLNDVDAFFLLTDRHGNILRNYTFGGKLHDQANAIAECLEGFAIVGKTKSYGNGNFYVWVLWTDKDGYLLREMTYGGEKEDEGLSIIYYFDRSIATVGQGEFVIAGYTYSYGARDSNVWVIRTSSTGQHLWNITFGGGNEDRGTGLVQTRDGGCAVVGYTKSYGAGDADVWVIRINNVGKQLWDAKFGGMSEDVGNGIVECTDGGFAVVGYTRSYGQGESDIWLIRISHTGEKVWSRTFGGSSYYYGYSLIQTPDYGFVVAGYNYSYGADGRDLWLIKATKEGETRWSRRFSGKLMDGGLSITMTSDGAFAVTGYTQPYYSQNNYVATWLLTINCTKGSYLTSKGCTLCEPGFYTVSTNSDSPLICPPGRYSDKHGAFECSYCPRGTYGSASGQTHCTKCPKNTYNPYSGSKKSSDCLACDSGKYSYEGSTWCITCLDWGIEGERTGPYFDFTQGDTAKCYFDHCPAGLGIDQSTNSLCLPCYQSCSECKYANTPYNCTRCKSGYEFYAGTCTSDFPGWIWPTVGLGGGMVYIAIVYILCRCCSRSRTEKHKSEKPTSKPEANQRVETIDRLDQSPKHEPAPLPIPKSAQQINANPIEPSSPLPHADPDFVKVRHFEGEFPPVIIGPLSPPPIDQSFDTPEPNSEEKKKAESPLNNGQPVKPREKPQKVPKPFEEPDSASLHSNEIEDLSLPPEKIEDVPPKDLPSLSKQPRDALPSPAQPSDASQLQVCVICYDRKREVAIFPCGHFILCAECSDKLQKCPLDEMPIENKRKIYMAQYYRYYTSKFYSLL
eukprot:TRINITY_DN1545_c0_g1_i1.p1 TRINITY_DN1545_c0_g1~~TRINITY_DN1545_c0_g1_i1.p1  ORF type:complete len:840 (-),score=50.39 TRINITY_DN1545_c0_g1_i1:81-2600(-)